MLDSSSYYLHLHAPILNPNVFPLIWPTHSNYRSFFLIFSLLDWSLVLKTFLSLYSVNIYDWFWLLLAYWTGSNPYFQRFEKRSSRSSRNNDLVEDIFQEFFTFWLIFGSENVLIFLFCELLRLISIAASLLNRPLPLVSTFWKKKQPFQQKERFGRWPFFKNFGPQNTFIFKIYYWFMLWLIYFCLIVFAYYLPSIPSIRVSIGRNLDSKREYWRVKRFSVDHLFSMSTDWWTSFIHPLSGRDCVKVPDPKLSKVKA